MIPFCLVSRWSHDDRWLTAQENPRYSDFLWSVDLLHHLSTRYPLLQVSLEVHDVTVEPGDGNILDVHRQHPKKRGLDQS